MSGLPPSASPQKGKRRKGGGKSSEDHDQVKVYLHAVTDEQSALLTDSVNTPPLQKVKKKSGADVEFDPNPSPVPGMKTIIIRGILSQIEDAIRLINKKTGSKATLSEEAQEFWVRWVEASFPELDSRAYFLPPVYLNRVPMTRELIAGQDVLLLQSEPGQVGQTNQQGAQDPTHPRPSFQNSDLRDDAVCQRVFFCLETMSKQHNEVLVAISQLSFGQYLGEPHFAAAAVCLPLPANLPSALPRHWKRGDFDVLLIHRQYGLVVCEVKAFGDNTQTLSMSQQEINKNIGKKLKQAVSQLDKAEAMLSHLVSDIAPGLRITKTIAFPNLTAHQLQQAISGDTQLTQDLCRCLGTTDPADITGLCLCCDQLSDPKTPCDVSSHVLTELGHWWQRLVAEGWG
ncbi:uncharacterized protein LOC112575309 [Pomacea canaliculata]|uniref:uncharacterized protein LOC112575309 n=1 Tax=Pomacea canaliculata TaxID=400727 RepID=UPI000D73DF7D|nr:uncharacterized protein LOC112575309 [Pomacea canaliculata]